MYQIIKNNRGLALEFIAICILLPTLIITYRLAPYMITLLWGTALYCGLTLYRKDKTIFKTMWKWSAVTWETMKPILIRFAIACVLMTAFIYVYDPEKMFGLLKRKPLLVPVLFFLYPILSALPQEFIFCTYFFKRFAPFFRSNQAKIIASAIVFAYAHVLFINIVAPTLSIIAGYIFAQTYAQHKSLALVTIEHGLYGNFLFIIGLGWYFHTGTVPQ